MRPFPPCGTQTGTGFARVPRRPGGVRAGRCSAAWVTEPAWRAAGVTILWSPLRGQQHPVQQVPRAEELAGACMDTPEVRATQRRPGCSPLHTDARNSQAGARAPAQGPKRQRPGRPAEARTRRSGKSRAAGPSGELATSPRQPSPARSHARGLLSSMALLQPCPHACPLQSGSQLEPLANTSHRRRCLGAPRLRDRPPSPRTRGCHLLALAAMARGGRQNAAREPLLPTCAPHSVSWELLFCV